MGVDFYREEIDRDLNKEKISKVQNGESHELRLEDPTKEELEIALSFSTLTLLDISFSRIPTEEKLKAHSDVLELGISKLKELKYLFLNGWGLKELPKSISKLKKLELLNLSCNPFEQFPEAITKLKSLKYLCIDPAAFNAMSEEESRLSNLELLAINNQANGKLILKKSEVFFPEYISIGQILDVRNLYKFPQIKSLDLSGVTKDIIAKIDFSKFPGLQNLGLFSCMLEETPESLFSLTQLKRLELGQNEISAFPSKVFELKKLEALIMNSNKIKEIPTTINNHPFIENKIELPYSNFPFSFGLDLRNNPIENVPPEIVDQGFGAIKNYFSSIEEGAVVSLFSAKLMILGGGGVGKTTLLKKLINPDYQVGNILEDTTRGIDIAEWEFVPEGRSERFEARIWDFGGQSHYLAPHQFFLTKRSLYLLVWDAREEGDLFFWDWLNLIKILSDSAPVIVVMNKCELRPKSIDEAGIKKMFPNIVSFHKVSCTKNIGIDALRFDIQNILASLPHVQERVSFTWKYIRNSLEASRKSKNYITASDYYKICSNRGLNLIQSEYLSNYFHDLGTIIHFNTIPSLLNTVILNPQWLTDAVYSIIDDNKISEKFGRFNLSDLKRIWDAQKYPVDKFPVLLDLMEKFSICFKHVQEGEYLTPHRLNPSEPEINWSFSKRISFQYHYPFLPNGIMMKFIVRNNRELTEDSILWRNGVFIKKDSYEILVKEDRINSTVSIEVKGEEGIRKVLDWLIKELEDINGFYSNLEVKKMLPCICSECTNSDSPRFFELSLLLKRMKKGTKDTIECPLSMEDVKMADIIGPFGFEPEKRGRLGPELKRRREDSVSKEKRGISIFISYSSKDRGLREILSSGLSSHLKQRKDFNYRIWSDKDILIGANWRTEIETALNECEVALILVSANFASSSFIEDHELAVFFKRKKEENFLILPVLVRNYDFNQFEKLSSLNFFKTYYDEYGFNKPTQRHNLMPFDVLGDDENTTDKQLQDYYGKLADFVHMAVTNHFA